MFLSVFLHPSAPLSVEWAKVAGGTICPGSRTGWRWKRKLCLFGQNHHFLKVHSPQLLNRSPKRTSECGSRRVRVTPGAAVGQPCIWSCLFCGARATHRAHILAVHPMENAEGRFTFSEVRLSMELGWYNIICHIVKWFANDQVKFLNHAWNIPFSDY